MKRVCIKRMSLASGHHFLRLDWFWVRLGVLGAAAGLLARWKTVPGYLPGSAASVRRQRRKRRIGRPRHCARPCVQVRLCCRAPCSADGMEHCQPKVRYRQLLNGCSICLWHVNASLDAQCCLAYNFTRASQSSPLRLSVCILKTCLKLGNVVWEKRSSKKEGKMGR